MRRDRFFPSRPVLGVEWKMGDELVAAHESGASWKTTQFQQPIRNLILVVCDVPVPMPFSGRFQRERIALLAEAQGFVGSLSVSDVGDHGVPAQHFGGPVASAQCGQMKPARSAVSKLEDARFE